MGLFDFGQTEEEKAEKNRRKEEKRQLKQEAKEQRKKEEQAKIEENRARSEKFNKTKSTTRSTCLVLDEENKFFKILFGNLLNSYRIFSFDELQNYEIYENGSSVSKGGVSAGRAMIGGALAGPAGLLLGGLSGKKKVNSVCDRLSVKFSVGGLHDGTYEIKLITQSTKKDSFVYRDAVKKADEIIHLFDNIVAATTVVTENNLSIADELLKLKSLVDSEILTQEEFELQKAKLLGK